jgi:hypothetical protein
MDAQQWSAVFDGLELLWPLFAVAGVGLTAYIASL